MGSTIGMGVSIGTLLGGGAVGCVGGIIAVGARGTLAGR